MTDNVAAFSINPATTATPLAQTGIYDLGGLGPRGLAFEPTLGQYVAVALSGSNAVGVYSVGPTGVTAVATLPGVVNAQSVAWVALFKPVDATTLQAGCDKTSGNLGTGAGAARAFYISSVMFH